MALALGREMIQFGMALSPDIAEFVQYMSVPIPDYSERLKAAFVKEYDEFYGQGYRGDQLFSALLFFVTGSSTEFEMQCAALGVLAYMFSMCEVFEP